MLGNLMLFQRTYGFYAGVGGFRALGHKVFPEKFRLSVAQKVLWG